MKRLLAALLLCLLVPACALAFDLSEYEIPESAGCHVVPLGNGRTLIRNPSYDIRIPDATRMADSGRITERITLPYDPEWISRYDPFAYPDGAMGVLSYTQSMEAAHIRSNYTLYDVADGELVNARPIAGSPTSLRRIGSRFIGLREEAGLLVTLLLYGDDEQLLHELTLTKFHGRIQSACTDGNATLVMIELWDDTDDRSREQMLTLYIAADGQIRWQNQHAWSQPRTQVNYNQVFPDGQGGAFLMGSAAESYKLKSLRHIDSHGKVVWTKELQAGNAIFDIDAVQPNPDKRTVSCIGTVIANSQRLFNAFAMELDLSGNILSLDVRDFSARGDYNFSCVFAPDAAAYAISDSATFEANYDKPCVAVPLDKLPEARNPGIEIN